MRCMNKIVASILAATATAALLTSCSEKQDASLVQASASAGITPLGDADKKMKTLRPEAPAQLMVKDVRIGQHDTFERVVFELEGSGDPGWHIDYTPKPAQQGSGNPIKYDGKTALEVNIDGTAYPFEMGKEDPNIGTVEGAGGAITEVISSGTFEGRSQFVIGLKRELPYSVEVLRGPTRMVIDIRNN